MKKILRIIPWFLALLFASLYIGDNTIYQERNVVRMSSGLNPFILEDSRVVLYYNNWAETLHSDQKFEVRFYLLDKDQTWTVQTITPSFSEKQLLLFKSIKGTEYYAITPSTSEAVRWDYSRRIIEQVKKDQIPSLESMQPLIATADVFHNNIKQ